MNYARKYRSKSSRKLPRQRTRRLRFLEQLEDRRLLATITWDGEAGDGLWSSTQNWFNTTSGTNNVAPGPGDEVVIPADGENGPTVLFDLGNHTVQSIDSSGALIIGSGKTLTTLGDSSFAELYIGAGSANGSGTWTVETLVWNAGTLQTASGQSRLDVSVTESLTIDAENGVSLNSATLRNQGTGTWTSGSIGMNTSATFVNEGTFTVSSSSQMGNPFHQPRIYNQPDKQWIKQGAATTTLNARFYNNGEVTVDEGTLIINQSYRAPGEVRESSGTITVVADADLIMGGDVTLTADSAIDAGGDVTMTHGNIELLGTLDVDGTLHMNGAHLDVSSAPTWPRVELTGGSIDASGTVTIDELDWVGGSLNQLSGGAAAQFNVTTDLNIHPSSGVTLGSGTLRNQGAGTWSTGSINMPTAASFVNEGVFTVSSSSQMGNPFQQPRIYNQPGKQWIKQGNVTTTLDARFYNNGEVTVEEGTLTINQSYRAPGEVRESSGTIIVAATAELVLGGDVTLTPDSAINAGGDVTMTDGNIVLQGMLDVDGTLHMDGAHLDVSSAPTWPRVELTGGSIDASGTVTIDVLDWTGGSLNRLSGGDAARYDITTNLNIHPNSGVSLFSSTLTNQGSGTWSSGNILMDTWATFVNEGVFTVNSPGEFGNGFAQPRIYNQPGKQWIKQGTGSTTLYARVYNNGEVTVEEGTFTINQSYRAPGEVRESSGMVTVAAAANLVMGGDVTLTPESVIDAAGDVTMTQGNIELLGTLDSAGTLHMAGAHLYVSSAPTWARVELTGGSIHASGTVTMEELDWTAGSLYQLSGGAAVHFDVTNDLNIHPSNSVTLGGGTLTSRQTGNWSSGSLSMSSGSRLVNEGTFTATSSGRITGGSASVSNTGSWMENHANHSAHEPSFENTGDLWIQSGGVNYRRLLQRDGTVQLQDSLLTLGAVSEVTGGVIGGGGRIVANLVNDGATLAPGMDGTGALTIDGNYTQTSSGRTAIQLGGIDSADNDLLEITGVAAFGGTLALATIDGFSPPIGSQYDVITYADRDPAHLTFADLDGQVVVPAKRMEPDYLTNRLRLDTLFDAPSASAEIDAGLADLRTLLPTWTAVFDVDPPLPVVTDDLNNLFNLGAVNGPAQQIGDQFVAGNAINPSSLEDIRDALVAAGYEIDCVDTACDNGFIEAHRTINGAAVSGSAEFDDQTHAWLTANGLASAANLDGVIDFQGTLKSDLRFGLDDYGFYVSSDRPLWLQFSVDPNGVDQIADQYDLSGNQMGLVTQSTSSAAANLTIDVVSASSPLRLRRNELDTPTPLLDTVANGTVDVLLDLTLTRNKDPLDYSFTDSWAFDVADNAVTVNATLAPGFQEPFVDVLADQLEELNKRALSTQLKDAISQLPLPAIGDTSQPRAASTTTEDVSQPIQSETVWWDFAFNQLSNSFSDIDRLKGQGIYYTQGDAVLRSAELRARTGALGDGIVVGVISDGVVGIDSAQNSGDIPTSFADLPQGSEDPWVKVLRQGTGSEGVAMMEIIHDIAPQASLLFYGIRKTDTDPASFDTRDAFVRGIDELRSAGADIIVDDIGFLKEPFFDDGYVGGKVSGIVNAGAIPPDSLMQDVLFVSAAGNDAETHHQATYTPVTHTLITPEDLGGSGLPETRTVHGHDGGSVLEFTAVPGTHWIRLQSSDSEPNAFRLRPVVDVGGVDVVADAVFEQEANGPLIEVSTQLPGQVVRLIIEPTEHLATGSQPQLELFWSQGMTLAGAQPGDAIYGHPAVQNVLTVGSVNWDTPNDRASYSSQGPSTINGESAARQSLDVVAADAVRVSGAGGFPREFYGTSAAAPHAAGIAALLMELLREDQTPRADWDNHVLNAIRGSAVDLGAAGYDADFGFGRLDAMAAAEMLNLVPGVAPTVPDPTKPRGVNLLEAMGYTIETVISPANLRQFLSGETLGTDFIKLRQQIGPLGPSLSAGFGFNLGTDALGRIEDAGLTGSIEAKLTPEIRYVFGLNEGGEFVSNESYFGGRVVATPQGRAKYDPFDITLSGEIIANPQVSFASLPERFAPDDIPSLLTDAEYSLGNVRATVRADLALGFLDYVDVDGDPSNNSENGGDPFVISGTATVNADFDTFDITNLGEFEFRFSNLELINPDVNQDGIHDFTVGAFLENVYEFGSDMLDGLGVLDYLGDAFNDQSSEPTEYRTLPPGVIPDAAPIVPEIAAARTAIRTHVQTQMAASQPPQSDAVRSILTSTLGTPQDTPGGSETTVFSRATDALNTANRAKLIEALVAAGQFKITKGSLNLADVEQLDQALEQLDAMLAEAIRNAFDSNNNACIAEMSGQTTHVSPQAIDNALKALQWAETAEHEGLATQENGLQLADLMQRFCLRAVIEPIDDGQGTAPYVDLEGNLAARVGLAFRDASGTFGLPIFGPVAGLNVTLEAQRNNNRISQQERLKPDGLGEVHTRILLGDGDSGYEVRAAVSLATTLDERPYSFQLPTETLGGATVLPSLHVDLVSEDLQLEDNRLLLNPNDKVTFRVQVRRGNGGVPNATLGLQVQSADGRAISCDAIEIQHNALGARQAGDGCGAVTDRDGGFLFSYQAGPSVQDQPDRIIVVYHEDNRAYVETIDVLVGDLENDPLYELIGRPIRPQLDLDDVSDEEQQFRDEWTPLATSEQITDEMRDALQPGALVWYSVFTAEPTGLLYRAAQPDATAQEVRLGLGEFASWRRDVGILGITGIDPGSSENEFAATAVAQARAAIQRMYDEAVARVTPAAASTAEGMAPIYEAAGWVRTAESLGVTGPDLSMQSLIRDAALSIEWSPQLAGYPNAALSIPGANLRIGGVYPDFPAPVQVLIRPSGTTTSTLNQGYLGYEPVFDDATQSVLLTEVVGGLNAQLTRGPGEASVAVTVQAGLPGISLPIATVSKEVTTQPTMQLFVKRASQDGIGKEVDQLDNPGRIVLPEDETLEFVAELRQGDQPMAEALVEIRRVGNGAFNKRGDLTDAAGRISFTYTPPVSSDGINNTVIQARVTIGGQVTVKSLSVNYTPSASGQDGSDSDNTPEAQQAINNIKLERNQGAQSDINVIRQHLSNWYTGNPGVLSRLDALAGGDQPVDDDQVADFDEQLEVAYQNLADWYTQTVVWGEEATFQSQFEEARVRLAAAVHQGLASMGQRCQAIAAQAQNPFDLNLDALSAEARRAMRWRQAAIDIGLPQVAESLVLDTQASCMSVEFVEAPQITGPLNAADVNLRAGIFVPGIDTPYFSNLVEIRVFDQGNTIQAASGTEQVAQGTFAGSTAVQDGAFSSRLTATQGQTAIQGTVAVMFENYQWFAQEIEYTGTPQVRLTAALANDGTDNMTRNPGVAVDGERVIVEVTLVRGSAPLAGETVFVQNFGAGAMLAGQFVTNDEGKVRLVYYPPADQTGLTQIGVSYFDGEQDRTDTMAISFDTTTNNPDAVVAIAPAEALAKSKIGRLLAEYGAAALTDSNAQVDHAGIAAALQEWLDSGLDDASQPCGIRCQLEAAEVDNDPERFRAAIRSYLNWQALRDITSEVEQLLSTEAANLFDEFDVAVRGAIVDRLGQAQSQNSGDDAVAALMLATDGEIWFIPEDDPLHSFAAVSAALKYSIQIDSVEFVGQPTDARLEVSVSATLDGQPATQQVPFDVTVSPLQRNRVGGIADDLVGKTEAGSFSTTAALSDGDTKLDVIVTAGIAGIPQLRLARQRQTVEGATGLRVVGRVEDSAEPPQDALTIPTGKTAIISGRVAQGRGTLPNQPVLFTLIGEGSLEYLDNQQDSARFTPPVGVSGTTRIVAIYYADQADGRLSRAEMMVAYGGATLPSADTEAGEAGGLFQSLLTPFNTRSLPLSTDSVPLGTATGIGNTTVGSDDAFTVIDHVDFNDIIDWFNHGLPAAPQELIRVNVDLSTASPAPGTLFDANLGTIMPDGWNGRIYLDNPLLEGNLVFGVDTSFSPFYLLTQPDAAAVQAAQTEQEREAANAVTHLTATLGMGVEMGLDEPLLGGSLDINQASGHATTKIDVDFSRVAADPSFGGKLRLHQLGELSNVYITFPDGLVRSFEALLDGEVQIPQLELRDPETGESSTLGVIGTARKRPGDYPVEFEIRSGAESISDDVRARLQTEVTTSDLYEDNDTIALVDARPLGGGSPNLGLLDGPWFAESLTLQDAADWYRFEIGEEGNSRNFVQIDFDHLRGDLDLAVYHRDADGTLVEVGTDGLGGRDFARISLWGQPAGTYYARVFDGRNPYYALTIDPPGYAPRGISADFESFELNSLSFVAGIDTSGKYHGEIDGQLALPLGTLTDPDSQQPIQTDVTFHGELSNEGFAASVYGSIGGDAVLTLDLPSPVHPQITAELNSKTGGFLIFDYQDQPLRRFKFAGLDKDTDRWVIGSYDEQSGWTVPESARAPAATEMAESMGDHRTIRLTLDGNRADLELRPATGGEFSTLVSHTFNDTLSDGRLGLGQQRGLARFQSLRIESIGNDGSVQLVLHDLFADGLDRRWGLENLAGNDGSEADGDTQQGNGAEPSPSGIQSGLWSTKDGQLQGSSARIRLGDWLQVERATLGGELEIPFEPADPPVFPPMVDLNDINFSVGLSNADAVLGVVESGGTKLYPNRDDSPQGWVALRDFSALFVENGVEVSGTVSAGIQDVVFFRIENAQLNLTTDPTTHLLEASAVAVDVPFFRNEDDDNTDPNQSPGPCGPGEAFICLTGDDPDTPQVEDDAILALAKPTAGNLIPEFKLLKDDVALLFNVDDVLEKFALADILPAKINALGLEFNDRDDLSDLSLFVDAEIDLDHPWLADLGFTPIISIGPTPLNANGIPKCPLEQRESLPGDGTMCNGFLSASLHLPSLAGDNPIMAFEQLGPIHLGFKDVEVAGMKLGGAILLGEFNQGVFDGTVGGQISVSGGEGSEAFAAMIGATGSLATQQTGDAVVSTLDLNWHGSGSGTIGQNGLNIGTEDADVQFNMTLQNTATANDPISLGGVCKEDESPDVDGNCPIFRLESFETGTITVDIGPYVTLTGSGEFDFSKTDGPSAVLETFRVKFNSALGDLAGVELAGGGVGVGLDGQLYLMPKDEAACATLPMDDRANDYRCNGAFVSVSQDTETPDGAMFGLPEWLPVRVDKLGIRFKGTDIDGDGTPDPLDLSDQFTRNEPTALANPANFSVVFSGGLQSVEDGWPLTARVENLEVDLGALAGCVATALPIEGEVRQLGLFSAPCAFPITNLEGVALGVEPFKIGPIQIGGGLELGLLEIDSDPDEPFAPERVLYGRVNGQLDYKGIGVGAEIVLTQYGPLLARLYAGVPVPIGGLIGAAIGSVVPGLGTAVGFSAGSQTGFIVTGMQGGLVFGVDPIDVDPERPEDLLDTPGLQAPLRMNREDIERAITPVVQANPTFAEIVSNISECNPFEMNSNDHGCTLPTAFTWSNGFRMVVSGTLTNMHVQNSIGAPITLGANIGYGENPEEQGFQLFGTADLEILDHKLGSAGIIFDLTGDRLQTLSPNIIAGAKFPSGKSWLSTLMPAQGKVGIAFDTDGYALAQLISTRIFFSTLASGALETATEFFDVVVDRIAARLEADRRASLDLSIDDLDLPDGFEPDPEAILWQVLLDLDADADLTEQEKARSITSEFLMQRLLGNGTQGDPDFIPPVLPADVGSLSELDQAYGSAAAGEMMQLLMAVGLELIADVDAGQMNLDLSALDGTGDRFYEDQLAMMQQVHEQTLLTIDDPASRAQLVNQFQQSLQSSQLLAVFARAMDVALDAGSKAIDAYFDVLNPSLTLRGLIQPVLLGIPIGPPKDEVHVKISKEEVTIQGRTTLLDKLQLIAPVPIPMRDELEVDVHIPFENLLKDLFLFRVPEIDIAGDDWRVDASGSLSVLGIAEGRVRALMFGEDANDLLFGTMDDPQVEGKVQVFDPDDPDFVLDSSKIQVPQQFAQRLVDHGGIVMDGRLTLPRLVTDPLGLFQDIVSNWDDFRGSGDDAICPAPESPVEIFACIQANPGGFFEFIGGLPDQLSEREAVAQFQAFLPNFLDDVLETAGAQWDDFDTSTDLRSQVIDAALQTSGAALTEVVDNYYLVGQWGSFPADEADFDPPLPTTSKLLGIDLGNARLLGAGDKLQVEGSYLGLAGFTFAIDLNQDEGGESFTDANGNGRYDSEETFEDGNANGVWDLGEPYDDTNANGRWDVAEPFDDANGNRQLDLGLPRVGGELVIGQAPAGCETLPHSTETPGVQIAGLLSSIGLGDADGLYDWVRIPDVDAGACVRAYSPGYDLNSGDTLKQAGGIEVLTDLRLPGLVDRAETTLRISPAADGGLIPDFRATATATALALPGLPITVSEVDLHMEKSAAGLTIYVDTQGAGLLGMEIADLYGELIVDANGFHGVLQLEPASGSAIAGLISGELFEVFLNADRNSNGDIVRQPGIFKIQGNAQVDIPLLLDDFGVSAVGDFIMSPGNEGLHTEISGELDVFGAITADLTRAEFDLSDRGLANVDIEGGFQIDIDVPEALGIGTLRVNTDDDDQLRLLGTFEGTVPGILELAGLGTVYGEIDERGCIRVDYLENSYYFTVPGGGCDPVVTVLTANLEVLESDAPTVTIEVALEGAPTDSTMVVDVDFDVFASSGVNVAPSDRLLQLKGDQPRQTIQVTIQNDTEYETSDSVRVVLTSVEANTNETVLLGRTSTTINVLNDDIPETIDFPGDSILIYDMDLATQDGFVFNISNDRARVNENNPVDGPRFTGSNLTTAATIYPDEGQLDYYVQSSGQTVVEPSLAARFGVPTPSDLSDDSNLQVPLNSLSEDLSFTVRPTSTSGFYRINGIEFWARSEDGQSPPWQIRADHDNFEHVLSSDESAQTIEYEGWTRYRDNFTTSVCTNGPTSFALSQQASSAWTIDNLVLRGERSDCLGNLADLLVELAIFEDQMDHRLPYAIDITDLGPGGIIDVSVYPGPNGSNGLLINVLGTTDDTVITAIGDGSAPENELLPVTIRTDGPVDAVDFSDVALFRGNIELGGSTALTDLVFDDIANGSTITVAGDLNSEFGSFIASTVGTENGDGVSMSVPGQLATVSVNSWNGGLWDLGAVEEVSVEGGNLAPESITIQGEMGIWTVNGGSFVPESFATGIAMPTTGGAIFAWGLADLGPDQGEGSNRDVGGRIGGDFQINGTLDRLESVGGAIDADVTADAIGVVQATTRYGREVELSGNFTVGRIERFQALGGDLTASLTTWDADHRDLRIGALRLDGLGGTIDSRNSFHIAGGIEEVRGTQVMARVVADGPVKTILATADPFTNSPAMLSGDFTAHSIESIAVIDGDAQIEVTTTGEFFETEDRIAVGQVVVDGGHWLGGTITTMPGTGVGSIVVAETPLGEIQGDLEVNADRLRELRTGDVFGDVVIRGDLDELIVERVFGRIDVEGTIGARSERNILDVNSDTFVSPVDALAVINFLNARPQPDVWSRYLDTTGDRLVSPADVLRVINFLNARVAGEGEAGVGGIDPWSEDAKVDWWFDNEAAEGASRRPWDLPSPNRATSANGEVSSSRADRTLDRRAESIVWTDELDDALDDLAEDVLSVRRHV